MTEHFEDDLLIFKIKHPDLYDDLLKVRISLGEITNDLKFIPFKKDLFFKGYEINDTEICTVYIDHWYGYLIFQGYHENNSYCLDNKIVFKFDNTDRLLRCFGHIDALDISTYKTVKMFGGKINFQKK